MRKDKLKHFLKYAGQTPAEKGGHAALDKEAENEAYVKGICG